MRILLIALLALQMAGCASVPDTTTTADTLGTVDDQPTTLTGAVDTAEAQPIPLPGVPHDRLPRITDNLYSERDLTMPWFSRTYWSKPRGSNTTILRDPELRVRNYQSVDCRKDITLVTPSMATQKTVSGGAASTHKDRSTLIPFAKNSLVLGPVGSAKLHRLIERLETHCKTSVANECIRLVGATLGGEQVGEFSSQDAIAVGRAAAVRRLIVESSDIDESRVRILQRDPSWKVRRVQVQLYDNS